MITKLDFLLAFIFTQVEVIFLTTWLYILIPSLIESPAGVLAAGVLEVGLLIEHLISRLKG